jgi:serine phosphatase RsbU (regulator of sigma subunit)
VLLFTDGVTDALNANRELFSSEERLIEISRRSAGNANSLLNHLISTVDAHIAGHEQYDDITLVAVQRKA